MRVKVNNRAMREINRSIVLDMIRRGGRISRTDLARRSSLTKPTISAIVEELIAQGVVQEAGLRQSLSSGGRRARLLEFNEASAAFAGIRFGVHHTRIAIADARGEIRERRELPSILGDPNRLLDDAVVALDAALRAAHIPRAHLQAVGVAVPGLVDTQTGECVLAPNLRWQNVPVRNMLSEKLSVPVVVYNVTTSGAVAEGRVGIAQGHRSFIWVGVGSGIGAGIVLGGRAFLGRRGFSGEIGHCQVIDEGPRCGCGAYGCLETVASGTALEQQAAEALRRGAVTSLAKDQEPQAPAIIRAALEGDALCRSLIERAGNYLGRGLAYMQNILNPEIIVLSGQLLEAEELLLEPARRAAAQHSLKAEQVPIVQSKLKQHAIIEGAVLLAMDHAMRSYRIMETRSPIFV